MELEPRSRGEIASALIDSEKNVASFFTSLSSEELALRAGTAWTALEQLEHLNSAVGAVAKGFAAPKLVLRFRFGRAKQAGRSYTQLRGEMLYFTIYHAGHHVAATKRRLPRFAGET